MIGAQIDNRETRSFSGSASAPTYALDIKAI
jgi:hypothetical protein